MSLPAPPAPPALPAPLLHRFSKYLAGCTVLLILAGSLVTSHDAGLSVPDWPTSYGWNMFTFPPSMWVANIRYEHVHRLIASTIGFLTIVLVVWVWLAEPRPWLRKFTFGALGAVVAQGLLGGLTVLFFLPPGVSIAHAALAEIFFCMTVAIALFTSPSWNSIATRVDDSRLRTMATATTIAMFCQILLGATMRHTGAGLAIPDFPLMFGHLIPDHWNAGIAIHFAHRAGALVVAAMAICNVGLHLAAAHRSRRDRAAGAGRPDPAGHPDHARRADRAQPPPAVDQQPPRGRRRAGAGDVAGDHAAQLARAGLLIPG